MTDMPCKETKDRKLYLDALRILACLFVIFNHTNKEGFQRYTDVTAPLPQYALDVTLAIACKCAVPLFFMISGALLLAREESLLATWKRIPKIFVDLVLFGFLYIQTDAWLNGAVLPVKNVLYEIVTAGYWHLWYLYAYIAFLLTLPILRRFVRGLDRQNALYLLVIAAFTQGVLPVLEFTFVRKGIYEPLKPAWIVTDIFLYPMAGYIVDRLLGPDTLKRKNMACLWVFNIACFAVSGWFEYRFLLSEPTLWYDERFLCGFVLVNAGTLFLTTKSFFTKYALTGSKVRYVITETGKTTFGIYLLHIWVLWRIPLFRSWWIGLENCRFLPPPLGVLCACAGTFVLAGVVTFVLRRILLLRTLF